MAITFDKKRLKLIHKKLKSGNKVYALKHSLFYAIMQTVFMGVMFKFISEKPADPRFYLLMFLFFIIIFLTSYFIQFKYSWKEEKKIYEESIEYFSKNNPSFIEDLDN
jgi:uncharacterized membrane protein